MITLLLILCLIPQFAFAGECDFSDYKVGEFYADKGKILWKSEDEREIEYIPFVEGGSEWTTTEEFRRLQIEWYERELGK